MTDDIRKAARLDIKQCRHSRQEISFQLSLLTGRSITVAQIDAYVAESKPHRFPLELVPAWVRVTESRRLLDVVAGPSGYQIADESQARLAEFGRTILDRESLARKEEQLRTSLREVAR